MILPLIPSLRIAAFAIALAVTIALPLRGADDTGSLAGVVLDASGASVPAATVSVRNSRMGFAQSVFSDDRGRFAFPALPPGGYVLRVTKTGFRETVIEGLNVTVGAQLSSRVDLVLGEISEAVTVSANAVQVEREAISVSTVVDRNLLERMPLNGRSFQTLIELAPGVAITPTRIASQGQFSVNGQRTNSNYFTIDGVSANVDAGTSFTFSAQTAGTLPALTSLGSTSSLANVDAVEEFRIQTSTFAPEYGRMPGGQISVVTRSGNNALRGSLFHYLRNEKLDANNWFSNEAGLDRAPLRQNLFGFALGGPVFLPKLYDGRNRTFFFLTYEGQRLRLPQFQNVLVPTAEARTQAVEATRPLINSFPLPNAEALATDPAFTGRDRTAYGDPGSGDSGAIRFDHAFSDTLRSFFRGSFSPSESAQRVFINQQNVVEKRADTYTGGITWTATPRTIVDLRMNYSRSMGDFRFDGLEIDGAELLPADAMFPAGSGLSFENASASISLRGFPDAINLTRGRVIKQQQEQIHLVPMLTYVQGGHEWKFGFDWRLLRPEVAPRIAGISYTFGTMERALANQLVSSSVQSFAPLVRFRYQNYSWYAQDTWRVHPRLTLTYGIRQEVNPAPSAVDGALPYTVEGLDDPITARLAPAGTSMFETPMGAFAPRVGAAWLLTANGDTVLRGGFGLFYDLGYGQAVAGYTSYPFGSFRSIAGGSYPLSAEGATPAPPNAAPPVASDFYAFPDFELPYTRQWNISIERQLGSGNVLSVAYVGSEGHRLSSRTLLANRPGNTRLNPAVFATGARVYVYGNTATSNYHSMQAQFRRALRYGLQVQAAYTWGKAIDDVSAEDIDGLPQTSAGFARSRGLADFDQRHNLTAAIVYDLPSSYTNPAARAVLGGWGIDSFIRMRSATPIDVITGTDDYVTGTSSASRPDLVAGVPLWINDPFVPRGKQLNAAAFTAPPQNRAGTLGRNAIAGLNRLRQVDLSLRRNFHLAERVGLEFRGELFNAFNTPNFANPNSRLSSSLFGVSTSMLAGGLSSYSSGGASLGFAPIFQIGGPRSVQFSLRLRF